MYTGASMSNIFLMMNHNFSGTNPLHFCPEDPRPGMPPHIVDVCQEEGCGRYEGQPEEAGDEEIVDHVRRVPLVLQKGKVWGEMGVSLADRGPQCQEGREHRQVLEE